MNRAWHVVSVMRPTLATGALGQTQGPPQIVCKDVQCTVKSLSGRELELARSTFAAATCEVTLAGDPNNPILETDYCEFKDGVHAKPRRLHIGNITDLNQNGRKYVLLCGESK